MIKQLIRALVVLLIVASCAAHAATTPNSFVAPQTPTRGVVQFLQGTDSAGTYKTLYTAGSNGSRCYGMWLTTNDATAHLMTIQIVNGGVKYGGLSISTGTTTPGFATGVGALNLLAASTWPGLPIDQYGNAYIQMVSGDTIQATFATALTSTDLINIVASCADF